MPRPKKIGYKGAALPAHVREGIKQMFMVEPNKSLIARTFGVNLSTVYRVLGKQDPEVVREQRQEAMARLASKAAVHAEKIIDNLEIPEDASYLQKMTGFGIAVDKVKGLDQRLDEKQRLDRADAGEIIALPEDLDSINSFIRNDLSQLCKIIGITIDVPRPGNKAVVISQLEAVEAEITKLSDLDPGASDASRQTRDLVDHSQGQSPHDGAGGSED